MSDAIKKVIRKIRRKFKPAPKPENPLKKIIAERKAEERKQANWERDKKIVRNANFQKAKVALDEKRKQDRIEKERRAEIEKQRLKNLKKARKVLAKKRSQDER